jgi:hypothetical protein
MNWSSVLPASVYQLERNSAWFANLSDSTEGYESISDNDIRRVSYAVLAMLFDVSPLAKVLLAGQVFC